jgi:hypothetical protein
LVFCEIYRKSSFVSVKKVSDAFKEFSMKNAILKKAVQAVFCLLLFAACSLFLACSGADEEASGYITIRVVGGVNSGGASSGGAVVSRSTTGYPPRDYPGGNASGPLIDQLTFKIFFGGTENKNGTPTTNANGNR